MPVILNPVVTSSVTAHSIKNQNQKESEESKKQSTQLQIETLDTSNEQKKQLISDNTS